MRVGIVSARRAEPRKQREQRKRMFACAAYDLSNTNCAVCVMTRGLKCTDGANPSRVVCEVSEGRPNGGVRLGGPPVVPRSCSFRWISLSDPSYPSCTRLAPVLHPSCWHCPSTVLPPPLLYCSSTVITAHMWLDTHPRDHSWSPLVGRPLWAVPY